MGNRICTTVTLFISLFSLGLLPLAHAQEREPSAVLFGHLVSTDADSTLARYAFYDDTGSLRIALALYGHKPVFFEEVEMAPDSSTLRFRWPGGAECALERQAPWVWRGPCASSEAAPRALAIGMETIPDFGQDLAVSEVDVAILDRAAEILTDETVWNRNDERVCEDDSREGRWSLFCALHKASLDVTGQYLHRRPALRVVRQVIFESASDRVYAHTLRDYNNHQNTTLAEVHECLLAGRTRLMQKL